MAFRVSAGTRLSPLLLILVTVAAVSGTDANDNLPASNEAARENLGLKTQTVPGQKLTQPSVDNALNTLIAPNAGLQQKPQDKNAAKSGSGSQTFQEQNAEQRGQNAETPNENSKWSALSAENADQRPNQNQNRVGQNPNRNRNLAGVNPSGEKNNLPGDAGNGKIDHLPGEQQHIQPQQAGNAGEARNAPTQPSQTIKTPDGATPNGATPRPGIARYSNMVGYQQNKNRVPENRGGSVNKPPNVPARTKPKPGTKAYATGSSDYQSGGRASKPRVATDPFGNVGGGSGEQIPGPSGCSNTTTGLTRQESGVQATEAVERFIYVILSVVMAIVGVAVMVVVVMTSVARRRRRQRYMRCGGFGDECEMRSNFQLVNNDERLGLRNSNNYFM